MNTDTQWKEWSAGWVAGPVVNANQLYADALRKKRRLRWHLAFEVLGTIFCISQVLRLLALVESPYWRAWAMEMLLMALMFQALALWNRRGIWNADGQSVRALLELSCRRARTAVRGVWLNLLSLMLAGASVLPLVVTERVASRHDRTSWNHFWLVAMLQLAVFTASSAWSLTMWRRAKRRLRRAEALLVQLG